MAPRFSDRLARLRDAMARPESVEGMEVAPAVDGLFVSHLEHVRYLTGFTGSSGVLIVGAHDARFVTDGRYALQAGREVAGIPVTLAPQRSFAEAAAQAARDLGIELLGFESAYLTVDGWRTLALATGDPNALAPRGGLVESVKAVKDPDEIAAMRVACALADEGCAYLETLLRPGKTERQVAWELEVFLRTHGATRLGFDTIIGSGSNGALVHGRAGDRKLGESGGPELVLCDFGAEVGGYHSDITRTFAINGEPTARMREVYEAVRDAQETAVQAIRPGVPGRAVDAAARERLAAAGLGDIPHNVGHGLGRQVHDLGAVLSPLSSWTLEPGMVVTVEPGAYIEGFGGVRIEDDVVVTDTGAERLTRFPRDLRVLG